MYLEARAISTLVGQRSSSVHEQPPPCLSPSWLTSVLHCWHACQSAQKPPQCTDQQWRSFACKTAHPQHELRETEHSTVVDKAALVAEATSGGHPVGVGLNKLLSVHASFWPLPEHCGPSCGMHVVKVWVPLLRKNFPFHGICCICHGPASLFPPHFERGGSGFRVWG